MRVSTTVVVLREIAGHKRTDTVRILSYEVLTVIRYRETESSMVVFRGGGKVTYYRVQSFSVAVKSSGERWWGW